MIWLIPLYAIAVVFPSWELTRYILAWQKEFGEFPVGGSVFGKAWVEIAFIWLTFLTGLSLVTALIIDRRK